MMIVERERNPCCQRHKPHDQHDPALPAIRRPPSPAIFFGREPDFLFVHFCGGLALSTLFVCCPSTFFFKSLALPLTCSAWAKRKTAEASTSRLEMIRSFMADSYPNR